MPFAEGETVAIAGGIAERQQLGAALAAVEQQRAGLLVTAPGTLTRRHDSDGTEGV